VYFRITEDGTELVDPQDVTSFSVVCPSAFDHDDLAEGVRRAGLGELLPGAEHLMVPVEAIRRFAAGQVGPQWTDELAGMVAYATSKGWVDEDGTRVRAHVERV
jgi:hypothetical protein